MSDEVVQRDAVRILFLLYYCGSLRTQMELDLDPVQRPNYTRTIDSETKLQKLDFWLRYPDHLAAALLRRCEDRSLSHRSSEIKEFIRSIFANEEPDLRCIDMLRYLYGAYEPLEEAISFLCSRTMAFRRSQAGTKSKQYFLTSKGSEIAERLLQEVPEMQWYADRCAIIMDFFGALDGYDIRKLQYLEDAYHNTPYKSPIPHVTKEVTRRFQRYFGEPL